MLGELLSTLSLESIAIALAQSHHTGREAALQPDTAVFVIRDLKILRTLLPPKLLNQMQGDLAKQYLFSFVLRHRVSQLALASHVIGGCAVAAESLLEADAASCLSLFQERGFSSRPLFGINSVGIFLRVPPQDRSCRITDSYEEIHCPNDGNPFCSLHRDEMWWDKTCQPKLTLSKMLQYYGDIDNCHQYSQEELEAMMAKFWQSYKLWYQESVHLDLESSLAIFGFNSPSQLNELGSEGLQKSFHKACLKLHPDHGGTAEEFINLKSAYKQLRRLVS